MEEATQRNRANLSSLRDKVTRRKEYMSQTEQSLEALKHTLSQQKAKLFGDIDQNFDPFIQYLVDRKQGLKKQIETASKRKIFELTDLQDRVRFQRESLERASEKVDLSLEGKGSVRGRGQRAGQSAIWDGNEGIMRLEASLQNLLSTLTLDLIGEGRHREGNGVGMDLSHIFHEQEDLSSLVVCLSKRLIAARGLLDGPQKVTGQRIEKVTPTTAEVRWDMNTHTDLYELEVLVDEDINRQEQDNVHNGNKHTSWSGRDNFCALVGLKSNTTHGVRIREVWLAGGEVGEGGEGYGGEGEGKIHGDWSNRLQIDTPRKPTGEIERIPNPKVLHITQLDVNCPVLTDIGGVAVTNLRTPTKASDFEGYDSILVSAHSGVDRVLLGNCLADAVDRGVTVVLVMFALNTANSGVPAGRFLDENYYGVTIMAHPSLHTIRTRRDWWSVSV